MAMKPLLRSRLKSDIREHSEVGLKYYAILLIFMPLLLWFEIL